MTRGSAITGPELANAVATACGGAVFVTTMSSVALLDAVPGSRDVFPAIAMMGAASTFALGIALARPEREVVVLDGDGSLLMELGSLVTIGSAAPTNLIHLVLDNGVWFAGTGEFAHPGRERADMVSIATASGYRYAASVRDVSGLEQAISSARAEEGPAFIRVELAPVEGKLWSDDNPQPDLPDEYFARVPRQAAELRASLMKAALPQ